MNEPNVYFDPLKSDVKLPQKPKVEKLSKKDLIFTLCFLIWSFVFVNFTLINGLALGFTITFLLLFVLTTIYLWKKEVKVSVFSYTCGALSVVGSVYFSVYQDGFIKSVMFFLVCALFTIYTCGISETFRHKQGSYKMLIDLVEGVTLIPASNMVLVVRSYKKSLANHKIKNVIIGLALSVPVLAVIVSLLSSSDAVFENVVSSLIFNFGGYFLQFMLALIITPLVVVYMIGKSKKHKSKIGSSKRKMKFVPNTVTNTFLAVICCTYCAYLFTQLAYFFSAFSSMLPEGYKYSASEYARRGFFEMFAICLINIAILSGSNLFTKKEAKSSVATKIMSAFICAFTILLIITAMSKMMLYVDIYGLTEKRIFVFTFMIMLLIIIGFFTLHQFAPKIGYMKPIIISCSIIFMLLAFADVDTIITKYNINAYYESQTIESLDIDYIRSLDDSSIPAIVEMVESDNEKIQEVAEYIVVRENVMYDYVGYDENGMVVYDELTDFRDFNYSHYKARKAIIDYYDSLPDNLKKEFLIGYKSNQI